MEPIHYVLVVISLVAFGFMAYSKVRKPERDLLRRLAVAHPQLHVVGDTARGTVEGVDVSVALEPVARSRSLVARLNDASSLLASHVGPAGLMGRIGSAVRGSDVEVGDPWFDQRVVLRGPGEELASRLDRNARHAVVQAVEAGWVQEVGEWRLALPEYRPQLALDRLDKGLAAVVALRARDSGPTDLFHIAMTDPEEGVRRKALGWRLSLGALSGEELDEVRRRWGVAALRVAESLDEGGETLFEDLLHDADGVARVGAARALALNGRCDAVVLDVLRTSLGRPECTLQAVEGLQAVGTVEDVPSLRGISERQHVQAVALAVRAIQARATGASAGQVSLAPASGQGGVAVVPDSDPR